MTPPKLYFAYGSNLWLSQMSLRCPSSIYLGLAKLSHWRWMINGRGYANVVPSDPDEVWGMVYSVTMADETKLDANEGVPRAYQKQMLEAELWLEVDGKKGNLEQPGKQERMLCYVNEKMIQDATPKEEYVHRMNMAIRDALAKGMPEAYVTDCLRPFIPTKAPSEEESIAEPKIWGATQLPR